MDAGRRKAAADFLRRAALAFGMQLCMAFPASADVDINADMGPSDGRSFERLEEAERQAEEKRLEQLEMLRQDGSTLVPVPVRLRGGYRSERDAIHLLHLVGNAYEPVLLFGRKQDGEIVG